MLFRSPQLIEQSDKPHGDTPIRMLNDAANRIGAGEAKLCAVVGAEALRTAAQRARRGASRSPKGRQKAQTSGRG